MGGGISTSDAATLGLPDTAGGSCSADVSPGGGLDAETADSALSCLVAVGRLLPASVSIQQLEAATIPPSMPSHHHTHPGAATGGEMASSSGSSSSAGSTSGSALQTLEFTARHTIDGNFSFADSHVAMVMG